MYVGSDPELVVDVGPDGKLVFEGPTCDDNDDSEEKVPIAELEETPVPVGKTAVVEF